MPSDKGNVRGRIRALEGKVGSLGDGCSRCRNLPLIEYQDVGEPLAPFAGDDRFTADRHCRKCGAEARGRVLLMGLPKSMTPQASGKENPNVE